MSFISVSDLSEARGLGVREEWVKRFGVALVLGVWALVCAVVLVVMQRERAAQLAPAGLEEWRRVTAQWGEGWLARHWLPRDEYAAEVLRAHWARRGVAVGLREEFWSAERNQDSGVDGQGWLELVDPEGRVRWAGPYPGGELRLPGVLIWDTRLIAAVLAGEPVPREVPVGCAPGAVFGDGRVRSIFSVIFSNPSLP